MSGASGSFSLSCPRIFDGDAFVHDHALVITDGIVTELIPHSQLPSTMPNEALTEGFLAPGFVDLQVNGGGDILFHDHPDPAALETVLLAHRRSGTTAMLPTILSGGRELRDAAIAAVDSLSRTQPGILGIHIEGPWFAPQRHGAHSSDALTRPSQEDIDALCDAPCRCLVTLAPEVVGVQGIAQLTEAGVTVAAGHTQATAEQIDEAQHHGLAGVTHLYNAMSPMQTRAPGTAGAALTNDKLWASLIADGHHVHATAIALALRAKPAGKLLLVSDAMATVGGERRSFDLYGEQIELEDDRLVNAQGKLAGSAIALVDAVRHLHINLDIPLEDCIRMASLYPATALGLERQLGRLQAGYRADIVQLDAGLNPMQVWAAGAPCV